MEPTIWAKASLGAAVIVSGAALASTLAFGGLLRREAALTSHQHEMPSFAKKHGPADITALTAYVRSLVN